MRQCRSWYRIRELLHSRLPLPPGPLADSLALWLQGRLLAGNGCLDRVVPAVPPADRYPTSAPRTAPLPCAAAGCRLPPPSAGPQPPLGPRLADPDGGTRPGRRPALPVAPRRLTPAPRSTAHQPPKAAPPRGPTAPVRILTAGPSPNLRRAHRNPIPIGFGAQHGPQHPRNLPARPEHLPNSSRKYPCQGTAGSRMQCTRSFQRSMTCSIRASTGGDSRTTALVGPLAADQQQLAAPAARPRPPGSAGSCSCPCVCAVVAGARCAVHYAQQLVQPIAFQGLAEGGVVVGDQGVQAAGLQFLEIGCPVEIRPRAAQMAGLALAVQHHGHRLCPVFQRQPGLVQQDRPGQLRRRVPGGLCLQPLHVPPQAGGAYEATQDLQASRGRAQADTEHVQAHQD